MDHRAFYDAIWAAKSRAEYQPPVKRDWFHRYISDPVFDPTINTRHDVPLSLLGKGTRLLDIGCWDGTFLGRVRAAGLFSELHGTDLPEQAIKTACERGFRAQRVDLNAEPLPFEDNYFDAVTFLAVLEHLFDPFAAIREVRRVICPGGELVIDVPNVASFTNRCRILLGRVPVTSQGEGWDGGHLHYFTKSCFDKFLKDEGFEILARRTSGGGASFRERWISLLGGELIYHCRKPERKQSGKRDSWA
jgi:ubiquinone/menaquinone biosynthesis C-methylase UbiE